MKISRLSEAIEILSQRQMILVLLIRLRNRNDYIFRHEARNVVHVTVRIISCNPAIHPQDLLDSQEIMEDTLQISAAKTWIALLHFTQQTLFRGEKHARAVCID